MTPKQRVVVCRGIFPAVVERLREHFEVITNDTDEPWSKDELKAKLQGAVGALTTGSERIDADLLAACPDLKIAANMAVGYNNFDVPACTARSVVCTNTPDVLTETTADMGFALLMAASRRVSESEAFLRAGKWGRWSYDMFISPDVHGSTLGILGMGRIGQAIAKRGALGFGMKVIYHNRSRLSADIEAPLGAKWVSKTDVFAQADHIVLVLPYSPEAHHTVAAAELALMKPSATITNIGRGGLIDENALADALQARQIFAAGLDVFEGEPKVNARLLACQNVVLTPHLGSASHKTRLAMADLAANNLIGYLSGQGAVTPI
jgi:gluconate 2-dehydrogenase